MAARPRAERRSTRRGSDTALALVLLDLGLPDVDGVQVCRRLRAACRSVPIMIVTARDTDLDIVVGLDAGATDYVTKPFAMEVLLARLRAHLRERPAAASAVLTVAPSGSRPRRTAPDSGRPSSTSAPRSCAAPPAAGRGGGQGGDPGPAPR